MGSDKFQHKFQCYILKFVYIKPCFSIIGPYPSISLNNFGPVHIIFGTDQKNIFNLENVKFSSEICFCAWSKLKTYFGPDQNNLDRFEIVLDQ